MYKLHSCFLLYHRLHTKRMAFCPELARKKPVRCQKGKRKRRKKEDETMEKESKEVPAFRFFRSENKVVDYLGSFFDFLLVFRPNYS